MNPIRYEQAAVVFLAIFVISLPLAATLYAISNAFWVTGVAISVVSIVAALLLGAS